MISYLKKSLIYIVSLCNIAGIYSCTTPNNNNQKITPKTESKKTAKFILLNRSVTGINFINRVKETDKQNSFYYPYMYNGGGVACGDINNDGLTDLVFTANQLSCRLYLNQGDFKFKDITQTSGLITSGWCTGVTLADINGDGWLDIYICRSGAFEPPQNRTNLLFINNKNGTFSEKAKNYGLNNNGYSTQAVFFDYDHDNDLDMFLVNNGVEKYFKITRFDDDNKAIDSFITQRLYRNNGNNTFTDVSSHAGVLSNSYGLNAVVSDLNNDGWPDIYVSNDYEMHDFCYINNKHGGFTESWLNCFRHGSLFSMGSDAADFNNDLHPDILTLDMLPESNLRRKMQYPAQNYDRYLMMLNGGYGKQFVQNALQLNNGDGTFCEIAEYAGIAATDWSWSALFCDFDNDGNKDVFISNGIKRDLPDLDFNLYRYEESRKTNGVENLNLKLLSKMPSVPLQNYIYKNRADLSFQNMSSQWGLVEKGFSNGTSYADLNNDGAMDLVINNLDGHPSVYKNTIADTTNEHFIKIQLKGYKQNKFGLGAKVYVYTGAERQLQEMSPTRGFESSVDYILHFGIGKYPSADSIKVVWPGGKTSTVKNKAANALVVISYYKSSKNKLPVLKTPNVFSERKAINLGIDFIHQENQYNDFKLEPLLPHMLSRLGPGIAVGDVNADGLEDFFVGGAAGQAGVLYLQQKSGVLFKKALKQPWDNDASQEDMGCLFFDADNDGDLDLYVVSGGNTQSSFAAYYQDRLYINNGTGTFKRDLQALPEIRGSGSCIVAGDFNNDGLIDLFRGGRVNTGSYPTDGNNYLLINIGGKFKNAAATSYAPNFTGMVTSALWTDYDNDGDLDLITVGEWTPVCIYKNNNGKLMKSSNSIGLTRSNGWWNSINGADLNGDGNIDYIVGNQGTNYRIKTNSRFPATVTFNDFDSNGSLDAVISQYYNNNKSYPICNRDDLTDQIRMLRRKFLRYNNYADKSIEQIFTPDEMKHAQTLYAYTFQSAMLINTVDKLTLNALPVQAQLGPVYGTLIDDFNNDNYQDVLLQGNNYDDCNPNGQSDALNGYLLAGGIGVPKRSIMHTAYYTPYAAKALVTVHLRDRQKLIISSQNNGPLHTFILPRAKHTMCLRPRNTDVRATITLGGGKKLIREIYRGSGYLSASSTWMDVPANVREIAITNSKHETRKLYRKDIYNGANEVLK